MGYRVEDFYIYADFRTATSTVETFIAAEFARFGDAEDRSFVLRRDKVQEHAQWSIVRVESDTPWGWIVLSKNGDKTLFRSDSLHQFDATEDAVRLFVKGLEKYLDGLGLLDLPKPTDIQRTAKAGELADMSDAGDGRHEKPRAKKGITPRDRNIEKLQKVLTAAENSEDLPLPTLNKLCKAIGVSKNTIKSYLRELGIPSWQEKRQDLIRIRDQGSKSVN